MSSSRDAICATVIWRRTSSSAALSAIGIRLRGVELRLRRNPLAGPVSAGDRGPRSRAQPRTPRASPAPAAPQTSSLRCCEVSSRASRARASATCAAWSARSACCNSPSTANSGAPARDLIAFAHGQRFDAAGLVRPDEDEVGFDPPLQPAIVVIAGGERERECQDGELFSSAPPAEQGCRYARESFSGTSSGSYFSNSALHMIATRPGAMISCGKRTSASSASSPRCTARASSGRMIASTRAITSR